MTVGSNFTLGGGSGPSPVALDFNRSEDCVNVDGGHRVVIWDMMLLGGAQAGSLRRMVPFFSVSAGSVVKVENALVSVDTSSLPDYSLTELQDEVLQLARSGDADRDPNVTVATLSEFWHKQVYRWKRRSTRGVLVGRHDDPRQRVNGD